MRFSDPRERRVRGVAPVVRDAARLLRRADTPTAKAMWLRLQNRRLAGLKFRRQHPIGRFVLDFYCPAAKLALELDGGVHKAQVEEDAARTEHLALYGMDVLRIPNDDVTANVEAVLARIRTACEDRIRDSAIRNRDRISS